MTGRRKNKQIHRLKNKNGDWKENEQELQEIITNYFGELFTSSGNAGNLSGRDKVQCVTEEQNKHLFQPISREEVKAAVFAMHPEKAPVYDGLNPAFNQAFWSVIEKDVMSNS